MWRRRLHILFMVFRCRCRCCCCCCCLHFYYCIHCGDCCASLNTLAVEWTKYIIKCECVYELRFKVHSVEQIQSKLKINRTKMNRTHNIHYDQMHTHISKMCSHFSRHFFLLIFIFVLVFLAVLVFSCAIALAFSCFYLPIILHSLF